MPVFVGVDAGGSATNVIAMRDEERLGDVVGDAANVRVAGIDASAETIARAVTSALGPISPDAVFVGAAGVGREDLRDALKHALEIRLPGARIDVGNDARIALRAAVPVLDAAVLIAGTGSIAYAEIGSTAYRTGGYGHVVGDDASGRAIGSAAVRIALRCYDMRGPRDALVEAVEAHFGTDDAQNMLRAIYEGDKPAQRLAALAPRVLALAGEGERSATKIVQAAALELFELTTALMRVAGLSDVGIPLVFAGGLLRANSLLSFLLETRIAAELPHVTPVKGAPAPQYGALALARELLRAQ